MTKFIHLTDNLQNPKRVEGNKSVEDVLKIASIGQLKNHPVIMSDSRWLASEGWVKMSNNVNGVEIHFVYNKITGAFDDFKFK